ncbi:MAG: hypothetical protein HOQ36_23485 [Nocardia sp.]|nr:hypothetical protein [Nocardia sp.]NUS95340.1 hypothetical protein [Nocardia sp.]
MPHRRPEAAREPDIDDVYRVKREALFHEDPERRAAARAEWWDELQAMMDRGHHQQADREFERVMGLPGYKSYGIPKEERPKNQFDTAGLDSEVAGDFGGREDVYPPQPSDLRYLRWAKDALNLGPDDVLMDVGSGTGKAITFFGMFTPAKKIYGMEIEPSLATFADQHAARLGLNHVRTLNRDVLEEPFPEGVTAAYFFEPFGSIEGKDAVGTFADKLADVGAQTPLRAAVKSDDLAERLEASEVFSRQAEEPFTYDFRGGLRELSWKLYTSGGPAAA